MTKYTRILTALILALIMCTDTAAGGAVPVFAYAETDMEEAGTDGQEEAAAEEREEALVDTKEAGPEEAADTGAGEEADTAEEETSDPESDEPKEENADEATISTPETETNSEAASYAAVEEASGEEPEDGIEGTEEEEVQEPEHKMWSFEFEDVEDERTTGTVAVEADCLPGTEADVQKADVSYENFEEQEILCAYEFFLTSEDGTEEQDATAKITISSKSIAGYEPDVLHLWRIAENEGPEEILDVEIKDDEVIFSAPVSGMYVITAEKEEEEAKENEQEEEVADIGINYDETAPEKEDTEEETAGGEEEDRQEEENEL